MAAKIIERNNSSRIEVTPFCTYPERRPPWCITLPSEAEWEKAARGHQDQHAYPWGNEPDPQRANVAEARINTTSVVGCFAAGASLYGCLEMAGNVWEWTRSLWGEDDQKPDFGYPYAPTDGREDLKASDNVSRILRGGSWYNEAGTVGCGARGYNDPDNRGDLGGFRVVVSPSTSESEYLTSEFLTF